MKKRKIRNFRITVVGALKAEEQEAHFTIPQLARLAMQAEQDLVPLILADKLDPMQALTLIAMQTHALLMNRKEAWLSEQALTNYSAIVLTCWKHQLFIPSDRFPYTFDQMFEAWGGELLDLRQFMKPSARSSSFFDA